MTTTTITEIDEPIEEIPRRVESFDRRPAVRMELKEGFPRPALVYLTLWDDAEDVEDDLDPSAYLELRNEHEIRIAANLLDAIEEIHVDLDFGKVVYWLYRAAEQIEEARKK